MDAMSRIDQALGTAIEQTLVAALANAQVLSSPPRLAAAVRHAVFPGGARIRPRLCLAVACACGEDDPAVADAAAASIELLHCASLVHDDLPCFDDAALRRGKPSVHRAFGERLAVLAGDALIVLAFQTLLRGAAVAPHRLVPLMHAITNAVGMPSGIVAGQAWECEPRAVLTEYHQAKTGALFAAATVCGAIATGAEPAPWRRLGYLLGEAYQVADDIQDVTADPEKLGKPTGRDAALDRPSAARELGLEAAMQRLDQLVEEAVESIPSCSSAVALRALIRIEAQRFLPKGLRRAA